MPDAAGLISHFQVKLNGTLVTEEFMRDLFEITVDSSLHMPDSATVVLNDLGWFAFWELMFFVAILALAYVYIWRKGALTWR